MKTNKISDESKLNGLIDIISIHHQKEKLMDDLRDIKANAWQEGFMSSVNYLSEYDHYIGLTDLLKNENNILPPIKPTNPYK